MGFGGPGQDGGGTTKSNKKAIEDTEVSAYEKELAKQKAKEQAEANVELGLDQPDFTSVTKDVLNPNNNVQEKKKTTTTNIGNGGNDGGNNNTPPPTILKKTAGGQTVQTTAPTEAELSQSAAADAEEYDLRKTKKRGRSMNTLTSSQGVTDDKLTLGKKSLLGS